MFVCAKFSKLKIYLGCKCQVSERMHNVIDLLGCPATVVPRWCPCFTADVFFSGNLQCDISELRGPIAAKL